MKASRHIQGLPSLKIVSFFVISLAILVFTSGIIVHYIVNMSSMLDKHERSNMQQQGDIVSSILAAYTDKTQSIGRDWASWDETFAFAVGENDTFIDEHLADNYPLLLHNFNFVVIKDLLGSDLHVEFFDVANDQELPVSQGFTDLLIPLGEDVVDNNVISFRIDEKQQNFTGHIDKDIPQTLIGDDQ